MALGFQSASIGGGTKNLVVAQDLNGSIAAAHVTVNGSGAEVGLAGNPFAVSITNLPSIQAVSAAALPLPSGAAQDGADAAGVAAPAGGAGIRGWLSGIYARLGATLSVSVANLPATQAVSAASLPLPSGAATAVKQPAPGLAGTPSADVLTVQGNPAGAPLPVSGTVADSNSAPFLGVAPITPGVTVAAQRSLGFICTAAGTVTLTLADASTLTIPLAVSAGAFQMLPFAVTKIALSNGTAGSFWGLK